VIRQGTERRRTRENVYQNSTASRKGIVTPEGAALREAE
jgi:hypothetical protein